MLYDANGQFFASYLREDLNGRYLFPRELPAEVEWTDEKLTVVGTVMLNRKVLGKILIESDLQDLRERTRAAVSLALAIAAGILLIAYLLTVILGRSITGPIQDLARTARTIAERTRELEIQIGERERAQIALRQSEEMFRSSGGHYAA